MTGNASAVRRLVVVALGWKFQNQNLQENGHGW